VVTDGHRFLLQEADETKKLLQAATTRVSDLELEADVAQARHEAEVRGNSGIHKHNGAVQAMT